MFVSSPVGVIESRNLPPRHCCSSRPSFCPDCQVSFSSIIRAIRRSGKTRPPASPQPTTTGPNRQNTTACILGGHSRDTNKQPNKSKKKVQAFRMKPGNRHICHSESSVGSVKQCKKRFISRKLLCFLHLHMTVIHFSQCCVLCMIVFDNGYTLISCTRSKVSCRNSCKSLVTRESPRRGNCEN